MGSRKKAGGAGKPQPGRVVAVTGAFGFLGRRLTRRLERDPDVERIVAIDLRSAVELARREGEPTDPASYLRAHSRVSAHQIDLTATGADRDLLDVFQSERVDTVCHLAFLSSPTHAVELAHELETIGTMYVLNATKAAGIERLSSLSSTMLYGARSDNPAWLTEDHPLRASDESRWLRDKIDADRQVRRFADANPSCRASVLRLGIVLGEGSRSFWPRYLGRPVVPTVLGYDPLFQVLHAEDAARGLHAVVKQGPRGVFNLVGRGVLPLSEVIHRLGHRALPIPATAGNALLSTLWRAQLVEIPPPFLDYLRWPWVAEGKRLEAAVGFSPRYTTAEALDRADAPVRDEDTATAPAPAPPDTEEARP